MFRSLVVLTFFSPLLVHAASSLRCGPAEPALTATWLLPASTPCTYNSNTGYYDLVCEGKVVGNFGSRENCSSSRELYCGATGDQPCSYNSNSGYYDLSCGGKIVGSFGSRETCGQSRNTYCGGGG